jgi:serine/threonine protein kinase
MIPGRILAGKYKIHGEIGRGGMGVVYEAEDTTLNRRVAIKVLPDVFTADPERLARFEREARVLASLNHPNIAAIYGLDKTEERRLIVLELVEGESLAERLDRGPLSLEETIGICRQITEGLEGAHEKGIVHRDLKPANIKMTPDRPVFFTTKSLLIMLFVGSMSYLPSNCFWKISSSLSLVRPGSSF